MKQYFVYIMASRRRGALYIGVTGNLIKRVHEHRTKQRVGFASKYNITKLVYFEHTESIISAIGREKALKKWRRDWKVQLIEKTNPEWRDLWDDIQ